MTYKAVVWRDGQYLMPVHDYELVMIAIGDGYRRLGYFQIPRYRFHACTVRVHYRYDNEYDQFCLNFSWYTGNIRHWSETWYSDNRFILSSVPFQHWDPGSRHRYPGWSRTRSGRFVLQ